MSYFHGRITGNFNLIVRAYTGASTAYDCYYVRTGALAGNVSAVVKAVNAATTASTAANDSTTTATIRIVTAALAAASNIPGTIATIAAAAAGAAIPYGPPILQLAPAAAIAIAEAAVISAAGSLSTQVSGSILLQSGVANPNNIAVIAGTIAAGFAAQIVVNNNITTSLPNITGAIGNAAATYGEYLVESNNGAVPFALAVTAAALAAAAAPASSNFTVAAIEAAALAVSSVFLDNDSIANGKSPLAAMTFTAASTAPGQISLLYNGSPIGSDGVNNGIIGVKSPATTDSTFHMTAYGDNMEPLNIPMDVPYAGVWYSLTNANGAQYNWNMLKYPAGTPSVFNSNGGGSYSFTNYDQSKMTLVLPQQTNLQFLFHPTNNGANIWTGGSCVTPASNSGPILSLFETFVGDTAGNFGGCNTAEDSGWLSSNFFQCMYTSNTECQAGYWYKYCAQGTTCGGATSNDWCLGTCPSGSGLCVHDYASTNSGTVPPVSCNPAQPNPPSTISTIWSKYKIYIIIAVVILFLTVIAGIIIVVVMRKKAKVVRK